MAKRAKASEPSEPEREMGIVKADEVAPGDDPLFEREEQPKALPASVDTPVDVPKETPTPSIPRNPPPPVSSGPTFGARVGRFFAFLLRVISLLILLSLLSLALYLALPWLYQKFIEPVQQNTAQVQVLQSKQKQTEQELADLQTKLATLETAQNGHDGSLKELDKRLSDIETEITARTKSLTELEDMQTKLQAQNEANSVEIDRQVNLLKSMELLSRARLFMYESNFGLAKQDVQIARDLLATVQPEAPKPLTDDLAAVVQRLDMALSNLPDFPVAASDDLDIAWQILLSGMPQATPTLVETPTPVSYLFTPTGILSATPTAIPTFTPTFPATVKPSATP